MLSRTLQPISNAIRIHSYSLRLHHKLIEDGKLLLAFDAFALSRFLGFEISLGNIIHGDDYVALKREDFRALHFSAMSSILPQW